MFLYADVRSRIHLPGQAQAPKTIYTAVATISGGEKLFGLQNVHNVVNSAYLYEASLLSSVPVGDVDYLTPYASNELVTLPGFKTDTYTFRYASYIPGSGTISCWAIVANSGRFCFLHLSISNVGAPRLASQSLFPPQPLWTKRRELSGDELTAMAVLAQRPTDAPMLTASRFTGGFAVGRTGWPTSPVYGNGLAGPSNSQLCLLLDQKAAHWFESILDGSHKRPRPFPVTQWYGWYFAHPKAQHVSPYDSHHHLLPAAKAWALQPKVYRGVVSRRFHAVSKTNALAYTSWRWRCARGTSWVKSGTVKIKRTACLK